MNRKPGISPHAEDLTGAAAGRPGETGQRARGARGADVDAPGGVVPMPASAGIAARPLRGDRGVKVVREVSLALALYGMAGWIYVGLCALVAPTTLALPLTHLLPSLREDTAGVLSFIVSFLGFISYRLTRRDRPDAARR